MGNDCIFLRDLELPCIIGTDDAERTHRQKITANLKLECDLSVASRSDRLEDAPDYSVLEREVLEIARESRFHLLERLAGAIAGQMLKHPEVTAVEVTLDKSPAVCKSRSIGVCIRRDRNHHQE